MLTCNRKEKINLYEARREETNLTNDSHRYFIIRHGETDWNKEFRYQGNSDIELNEDGALQARRVAVRLSRIMPARVLSSPLKRAARTAQIIAEHSEFPVEIELAPELREISFGCWEGLTIPEIKKLDGETFARWRSAPFSCAPSGGEEIGEVRARVEALTARLVPEGKPGEATFIVAHGGVLRALIAAMMLFPDLDLLWRLRFDNCSVTVIDIWGTRPSLLLTNDTHHLRSRDDEAAMSLVFPL